MKMQKKSWINTVFFGLALLLLGIMFLQVKLFVKADSVQTVANLVLFVKYPTDTGDIFNAEYRAPQPSGLHYNNWQEIKQMYQEGSGTPNNDSFQNYISTITEGKVNVVNVFPQEYDDPSKKGGKAVATYCLTKELYDNESELISEVIAYCNNNNILGNSSIKPDNVNAGIIDNLTIIIQGDFLPNNAPAHKAQYGGMDTLGGLRVFNYNMMSSSVLVTDDATIGVKQAQGVIAHEFLHTLGLPDLYRLTDSGIPVGAWDVMAANNSFLQYPLSYLRAQQGWIEMQEISAAGTYTLTAVSGSGGNKVFLIKTPISDSEYIVLEYRRKEEGYNTGLFEQRIPSSGLLMYRVDTKVQNGKNSDGDNYIYVYRPGVSHPENAMDVGADGVNLVHKAALGAGGSYGSTDLNAGFSENTLYYSDGSNSGVRISNVVISADGKQLTFDVEFADYTNGDVWDKLGDNIHDNVTGEPVICVNSDTETLYSVYETNGQIGMKSWNGSEWIALGGMISGASSPALAVCAGEIYVAYWDTINGQVICNKLTNGSYNVVGSYAAVNPLNIQLIVDGNNILVGYQEDLSNGQKKLVVRDIKKNQLITDDKSAGYFSNPSIVKVGSSIYVLYSDFMNNTTAKLEMYDTSKKCWSTVHEYSLSGTNCHVLKESNGKLYAFVGGMGKNPVVSIYEGAQWVDVSVNQMSDYHDVAMEIISDEVYLIYLDSNTDKTVMLRKEGTNFNALYENLGTKLISLDTCSSRENIYMAVKSINATEVTMRRKALTLPEYSLVLTPPAGYYDNRIYIDGIEYTAAKTGENYLVKLPHGNARTAVMYQYNENNIPVGMYVWRVNYANGSYSVMPLSGLQDLLSYHGFSIRVTSPSGIRFKSGIDATMKANLLGGGVDGYQLIEYGTLFMTNANRTGYPFVKLGRKSGGGRSYWKENGVINDRVFETISNRNRFASVLTKLPPEQYATEFAFRGYIILENGGERILLYGPIVSRSIYTVATQIMEKGEFAVGSGGYNYVQGIIKSVEE